MGRKSDGAAVEAASPLVLIEELFARHAVPTWQQAGLMVHAGWATGKSVTEAEFVTTLAAFRRGR